MYTSPSSLLLGFHGCDRSVGERVLGGGEIHLLRSENEYDWLGHGVYFWENNPARALEFACERRDTPRTSKVAIVDPFVLGAIIDPGSCLNLLESRSLRILREAYDALSKTLNLAGEPMPVNHVDPLSKEMLRRNLDCAVIETVHGPNPDRYDTVRGVFLEGSELYPGSAFREKNHIQICVRNTACIRGYFRLREPV